MCRPLWLDPSLNTSLAVQAAHGLLESVTGPVLLEASIKLSPLHGQFEASPFVRQYQLGVR
ncbi:hypothetical protein [Modicisalibacter luteus]|uniref:hypothetical protein n=1 Tax=Modicisalibacter luteus TaxID=453962 RepID=UPI0003AB15FD